MKRRGAKRSEEKRERKKSEGGRQRERGRKRERVCVCVCVYVCVYVCVLQSSGISAPIEIGFTLQVNAITTTNPLSKISAHLGAYS